MNYLSLYLVTDLLYQWASVWKSQRNINISSADNNIVYVTCYIIKPIKYQAWFNINFSERATTGFIRRYDTSYKENSLGEMIWQSLTRMYLSITGIAYGGINIDYFRLINKIKIFVFAACSEIWNDVSLTLSDHTIVLELAAFIRIKIFGSEAEYHGGVERPPHISSNMCYFIGRLNISCVFTQMPLVFHTEELQTRLYD